jgi:uncharacterized membrane protein YgcG
VPHRHGAASLSPEKGAVVSTIGGPEQPGQRRRKDPYPLMSNYSAGRGPRPADPYPRLRLAALTAVVAGVVLLAAAAFVLSYEGIHQIALHAGVTPKLARLYPLIFDAMLVVAGAAALALRGAGWWARAYAWSCLLVLLAAVAVGDALQATNVTLPAQPTRAALAVIPCVLLLLAFGLLLEILRHFRGTRATGARQARGPGQPPMSGEAAAPGQGAGGVTGNGVTGSGTAGNGDSSAGQRGAVTWAGAGGAGQGRPLPPPLSGLDALLGPREEPPPAMPEDGAVPLGYPGQPGQPDGGQYPDPVSYGEETGYVHPDSYLGHVSYSGQLYPGPEGDAGHYSQQPGMEGHAAAGSPAVALADDEPGKRPAPEPGPGAAQPGSPAPAGPEAAGPAEAPAVTDTGAPAATGAATGAPAATAPPAAEGPQAAVAGSPEATAQAAAATTATAAAGDQGSPGSGSGATPQTEAPDPAPPLERLRSTPVPPAE